MPIFGSYKTKAPRVINDEEILDEAEKPAINRSRTAARHESCSSNLPNGYDGGTLGFSSGRIC